MVLSLHHASFLICCPPVCSKSTLHVLCVVLSHRLLSHNIVAVSRQKILKRDSLLDENDFNITSYFPFLASFFILYFYFLIFPLQDSGNHQVNGTIIKYSCIPSNHFAPCSETTKKNISKWLTSWNKINLTGLRPWTKYSFSVQYVLSDSWTMETKIVQFVTLEASRSLVRNLFLMTLLYLS